ncbi:Helix-turn-helix domain-containing protein [Pseudomonas delhiensis]|uniref:Helix-turn-helix domain-containing protein n=1 Tax=Pseudomonas delhiensis TaxID=366289 RepID=A0A239KS73_9PSED|nr:helix-turn-helix domain-containing protein [Pseudomonas delhiensis]SDK61911.1 Helix-turn-helix domain-containing protein [Pseudomonas delhiensis]SNT20890.1 Helix-turn-helix domain-containing protein [Pseudomonas delhiensis]
MKVDIDSPATLGLLVRASRKAMNLRQDDAAGSIGVSENFLGKVERGAERVQWGKLFQVLQEFGLQVSIEVPEEYAEPTRQQLQRLIHKAEDGKEG